MPDGSKNKNAKFMMKSSPTLQLKSRRSHADILEAIRTKRYSQTSVKGKSVGLESPSGQLKTRRSKADILEAIRTKRSGPKSVKENSVGLESPSGQLKSRRSKADILDTVRSFSKTISKKNTAKSRRCQMDILDSIGTRIDETTVASVQSGHNVQTGHKMIGSLNANTHATKPIRTTESTRMRFVDGLIGSPPCDESETSEPSIPERRLPTTPVNSLQPDHVRYSKQNPTQQSHMHQFHTMSASMRERIFGDINSTPQTDELESVHSDEFPQTDESDTPMLPTSSKQTKSLRSLKGGVSSEHLEHCCVSMRQSVQVISAKSIRLLSSSFGSDSLPVRQLRSRARVDSEPISVGC